MSSINVKPAPIIYGDESMSDVTLVVDNQDFKINKTYLACRSDVFKAMFFGDFKESREDRVEIKDVSVNTFRRFLEIIYTGKTSDPSKFLEFPFEGKQHRETDIEYAGRGRGGGFGFCSPPCYREIFHNFWKDTTELLNIADRFNMTPIVKEYFGSIIPLSIFSCKKSECHQCFHSFIFALANGIDVSKCEKKYTKPLYTTWLVHAKGYPYPDSIPLKGINTIFKQIFE